MPHPFDSPPTADQPAPSAAGPPPPGAGRSIGPYKLLQKLGEGGMGAVWMAEQAEPVRRLVALKIIRPDRAGGHFLARFEAERQALALMDHPNIAKVLDAGEGPPAATGALPMPYLVMELVKGVPITQYCDDARLTVRQRVELFVPVCRAVQHAHSKGIIHRDLKPSNVLVALYDGLAVPKVIDFGVAKALHQRLTERTLVTELGAVVGTPEYMAPEQAEYNALDIDTRADIYSLGVVLYELLSGSPPFDRRRLQEAAILEILRLIKEVDPPTPSKQLSAAGTLPAIAARRRSDPDKLPSQLRGELDWIVMKALEKERTRRYPTADAFAADLERHLRDEPVLAGPPSAAYRLRKFVRKHRGRVIAAGLLLATLVAGLVGSATQAFRATRAEGELRTALHNESAERQRADAEAAAALGAKSTAEFESYVANLYAADAALASHEPERVRPRLDACPPRLRGWEWRYLAARSDTSLLTLRGHESLVNSVAFSPTGDRVVTASGDKTARVWDVATGRLVHTLSGHTNEVRTAMFNPAGDRVLTASFDRTARVWDAATGAIVMTLGPHKYGLQGATFDGTGNRILVREGEKAVRVWDARNAAALCGPITHAERVFSASFNPTGDRVVTASGPVARVWDVANGRELLVLRGHEFVVTAAAFSPSGHRIVTTSTDRTLRVWDAASGREQAVMRGHTSAVWTAAFLGGDDRVSSVSSDGTARVWDTGAGRELSSVTGSGQGLYALAHNAATNRMVLRGVDGTAWLWSGVGTVSEQALPPVFSPGGPVLVARQATGTPTGALRGHESRVTHAALSPAGDRVATASADGTARLWDAAGTHEPLVLRGHHSGIRTAMLDRTGDRLVTASDDTTARIWDLTTGRLVATLCCHELGLRMAAFDRDGRRAVTASGDKTARVWDASDARELAVLRGHEGEVVHAEFDAFGQRVLTLSDDGTAGVWDAASGRRSAVLSVSKSRLSCATFNPTGKSVATGSQDGTVRLWSADGAREPVVLAGQGRAVQCLLFSRGGEQLVAGTGDGIIRIWDTATRREIATLRGHTQPVPRLRFSPTEDRLLSQSWDGTARVWDLESGRELITLRGQGVSVVDAQFNATGDRVVTAMGGGTTRVWDAASGGELVTLRGHDAEVVAATFTPSGDRLVTASFDGTIRVWDGVSCRERFAAIAAARAAESVMRGRVAERLLSGLPPGDVARWLAEDPTLNDVHRNAGRIVLNEERERRQQAQDQKRIEARRLNAAAWEVVVRPNAPLAALDRALTQAQRAVELFPARPDYVHTLGVAQYRAGRFADAIVTLTRADEMHAKSPDGPQPVDWAVIAMARYKLGKLEESKAALGRARELMQDSRHSGNEEDVAFVREAASLIEAAP